MAFHAPPRALERIPTRVVLQAGTVLRRVHPATLRAHQPDRPQSSVFGGGGRFDATTGCGYRTLCASAAPETAIAERFLREFAATPGEERYLLRKALRGQVLSDLRTTADLSLIRLTTAQDLAAVHQDAWLITSRADDFPATREWAAWLHDRVTWADGILWQSVADMPRDTVVLFEDRFLAAGPVQEPPGAAGRALDAPEHRQWLADLLEPYGVRTRPPEPRAFEYFINYRTGDGDDAARLVHNELSRRLGEAAVFRDVCSIPHGEPDFERVLVEAARGCGHLLPIIGPDWEWGRAGPARGHPGDPDDWVRREILEARAAGARIVPILVGNRMALRAADLPEPLAFLAGTQFLHLPRGFSEPDVAVLVDKLLAGRNDN
ncbi:hypothetical protein FHS29_006198 [Saccharothrix tamanrassetensis]|uniref:RES domain-containing protein n=1 Tax=Saccharothrix tamanrassetensis TaxID=1051531 RepID=A0A841CU69_9PSEU|nr:RES family NAD+ phosphorylase [Saccharothrix tamanrassetensis]MBB5959577.1 hypothetical protein [Saccharothrix tamanrassetensis]